jgi:hypothetical protein
MGGYQTSGRQRVTDGMTISAMHGEMVGTVTRANASAAYCAAWYGQSSADAGCLDQEGINGRQLHVAISTT